MRCKKCGRTIPNGTLCEDCYNKIQEDKAIDNDKVVLMKVGRKFIPKYQILINWEWLLFCLFVVTIALLGKNFLTALSCVLVVGIILAVSMFISKRIAIGTKLIFFETKVVYKFDLFFIHKKKVLKYSEIKDITFNARKLQKKFGLGSIVVISKKSGLVFKGMVLEDVANGEEIFKKLTSLIGTKIG